MRCDEFDARVQNLLDTREIPQRDPALQHHAQQCPQCASQLSSVARLLSGLDALKTPNLPDDFAQQVVQQVSRPSRKGVSSTWRLVAVAIAATLLIALLPASWRLLHRSDPLANAQPIGGAKPAELAQVDTASPIPSQLGDTDQGWMVPDASLLELYPAETRRRHREQVNQIADNLRPIATPFNAAVTAIRRSIPVQQSAPEGEPRASTQQPRRARHLS